jgi:NAD(P)H-dependent FMN reductase
VTTGGAPILLVVIASTRSGRKGPAIGHWFIEQARRHARFELDVADLGEIDLPILDEPEHPRLRKYQHDHTKAWSARVDRADAFVFVTPEYNWGPPPSLLNAIDYVVHEWAYKPLGLVSYGGVSGGMRGVQIVRQMVTGLKMVPLPEAVAIPMFTRFINAETGEFAPDEVHTGNAARMLDELLRWSQALQALRTSPSPG